MPLTFLLISFYIQVMFQSYNKGASWPRSIREKCSLPVPRMNVYSLGNLLTFKIHFLPLLFSDHEPQGSGLLLPSLKDRYSI